VALPPRTPGHPLVSHTPEQPRTAEPVLVTARVTDPDGVGEVNLRYRWSKPAPTSSWRIPSMKRDGRPCRCAMMALGGDALAGDGVFSATVPAGVQQHRHLVRYRIEALDGGARAVRVPYPDDPEPNFAYFVTTVSRPEARCARRHGSIWATLHREFERDEPPSGDSPPGEAFRGRGEHLVQPLWRRRLPLGRHAGLQRPGL
jgi:hypothetical protein